MSSEEDIKESNRATQLSRIMAMTKAIFTTIDEAAETLNRTGRTWTPVKVKGGYQVRMNFGAGFRFVEQIDVYHILANSMYRAAA